MRQRVFGLTLALTVLSLVTPARAYAQGGSLSGVVVDTNGGIIPGVNVVVRNNATGTAFDSVTNTEGLFSVPALDPGVYTVTVSLTGFKTSVMNDVRIAPGVPNSVKAILEVGSVAESVNVTSSSEIINTQTATISSTLNVDQINMMPTASRNALNAVTFLPGVNTTGINRNSTINGLPESFINITLDGVSNNDNFQKSSDGFFASVTPRQDAIEAVTVTTAVGGADIGGSGASGINFATRSGTDRFSGSLYEYHRAPWLNTNYWFNERNGLPKNDVKLNQYGGRSGGPIVIPGLYDGRGKAFYFVNYEQLRLPNNFSRTRTVLNSRAQQGWFRYLVGSEVREVNVLQLAASNGQISSIDPMVAKLMASINSATASTGALAQQSDPLLVDYTWQSPGSQFEHQPVVRIDYNLGQESRHRLTLSSSVLLNVRDPDHLNNADRRFPSSTNYRKYTSTRPLYSLTLRSTLNSNLVSELRGGITRGGSSHFGVDSSNGVPTFDDQDGYAIDFDSNIGLTNWWNQNTPSWRSAYVYSIDETLSWQLGKHSVSFGGAMLFSRAWEMAQQMVPGIQLGFDNNSDPAIGLFTGGATGNFRDASAAQLTDAREFYGLLTGRVTSVTGQAALDPDTNTYAAFAPRRREGNIDMHSIFAQDSWRLTPTLTLNAGLRWDLQLPFSAANDTMSTVTMADVCGRSGEAGTGLYDQCRFLSPGATGGKVPTFQQLAKGTLGYNTDWNNVAPNVGVAWRPNVQSGFLRTLLGEPDQATLRGGYAVAYERQGIGEYTDVFGANPGSILSLTRNASTGLVNTAAGEQWPVLLSERSRLYNAPFPETPTYPIAIRPNRADSIEAFNPNVRIANAQTWTVSFQRALTTDMAIDIRYVGTRGVDQWSILDYNDIRGENLVNNGFLSEFQLAQANLQVNNAAGGNRSGSFAYFGPGTGTAPLPIYFAYLIGRGDPNVAANYTGGTNTWTNTTFAQRLVRVNPAPITAADDLDGNLTRRTNALNAGLAANFFVVNPDANEVNVTDSGAYSDYHALQVQLRRRLSKGFQIDGSYQFALEGGSAFLGFSKGRVMNPTGNVRHAIKTQWDWTIPVGRDQRFGSNLNPILNGILGGWQFNGVGRIQSRMFNLGNLRLVGMSVDELTKMYKFDLRVNPDNGLVTPYMLPEEVILNTRRAFSVSTTSATGYSSLGVPEGRYLAPANGPDCIQIYSGDCAPRTVMVRAPWFTRFDIGVTKRFPLRGSMNFEFKIDVLNVLDNVNFTPVGETGTNTAAGTSATIFQATAAYQDLSNTFDPGGRLGQLMFRLNW
jgi:Carboxypeptidase regulatory-like domain